MFAEKRIALVIPAYNEEKLIQPTLDNIPAVFDGVFVVDDKSPDNQNAVIEASAKKDPRIKLLRHEVNQGPGGAIITGYKQASLEGYDISVVIGGDFQMDLREVDRFLEPLVKGEASYTKGNRFLTSQISETLMRMPRIRQIGNWIITLLTKIASGYFNIMDVVDGYTAITKEAIDSINWDQAWKRYGYPMDFLIRLNAYGFKVKDIARTAIYLPGERQSQIKGFQYALQVSPMLIRGFFWRLKFKYMYLDFHPIFLFYFFSFILMGLGSALGLYLVVDWSLFGGYQVTGPRASLDAVFLLFGLQLFLNAMLLDMQKNA